MKDILTLSNTIGLENSSQRSSFLAIFVFLKLLSLLPDPSAGIPTIVGLLWASQMSDEKLFLIAFCKFTQLINCAHLCKMGRNCVEPSSCDRRISCLNHQWWRHKPFDGLCWISGQLLHIYIFCFRLFMDQRNNFKSSFTFWTTTRLFCPLEIVDPLEILLWGAVHIEIGWHFSPLSGHFHEFVPLLRLRARVAWLPLYDQLFHSAVGVRRANNGLKAFRSHFFKLKFFS